MTLNLSRYILAVLATILIVAVTLTLREEWNPDWIGYMKIYEDGAWLANDNRDLGFLAILSSVKVLPGGDYEMFRYLVVVYFAIFIFFLGKGSIIEYGKNHCAFISILFVLVCFSLVRFSIQIREGIAVTLMIIAIGILAKRTQSVSVKKESHREIFFVFILLLAAGSVHGGTLPFLYVFVFSLFLKNLYTRSPKLYGITIFYIRLFTTFIALTFPFLYSHVFAAYDTSFIGKLEATSLNTALTPGKIVYWIFHGCILFTIRYRLLKYLKTIPNSSFKIYIQFLSGVLLQMVFIISLLFMLLQYPGPIVSAFSRFMSIIMGISVLLLAFKTKNSLLLFVLTLFLIAEQVRTVVEALLSANFI